MRPLGPLAFVLAVVATLALVPAGASAQTYPTKPVRILIGFAPGGPTDVVGRILADYLTKAMGQPFVVESRTGASGVVAGQALVASAPDGHTLNLVNFAVMSVAKSMYPDMTYDPATDFAPVTVLVRSAMIILVNADVPARNLGEFVDWAKTNRGKVNYGSPGIGTLLHLASELLKSQLGFKSQHIVYRGGGPFGQGMIQKEIQWGLDVPNTTLNLIRGGHARAIAVTTPERWPAFPDVPTLTELGVKDAAWTNWFGLVSHGQTPRPIVEQLSAEIAKGWKTPEVVERLKTAGYEPWTLTPDETTRHFAAERARWTAVVKANNIKAE
ncbi:MAG: tripartite tricarboxylate transporter substrate binding protein [Alphaproteobacteria bacterium]|nr:tripartite tricarboxylate transporter substrate binding protein [Alphaproteobacteria bacterium]